MPRDPASFDSYGLFTDIYNNPQNYLNGTAPLNVTGCVNSCVYQLNESTSDPGVCTTAEGGARDSFMWYAIYCILRTPWEGYSCECRYDELHPSEQSDRIVAREITAVMKGEYNQWTTWLR
jgi:hypothetical protein